MPKLLPSVLASCTLLALTATVPLPSQQVITAEVPALDSLIRGKMEEAGIMGLSAAIIIRGKVVWIKGYGYADHRQARPFTPNTIMNVASITKPFVGVAMMRAVHEGKLSLDDDINRYLPFRVVNPHQPDARITLRQLATHTSSLTDRWEVYSQTYHYGADTPEPLAGFLADYFTPGRKYYDRGNFLAARPGTQREYSNIGAALAGYIVERAVGEPLNVYTKKQIFTPLGMSRTGWFYSEVDMANHSTLFVSQGGQPVPIQHYAGTTYPDGGIRTSVADLSRFFVAMLSGGAYEGTRILDAAAAAEMTRFQFTDANRPENFPAADGNSGLFWRTKFNGTLIGHGGNDPGVQADMLANLSKDVAVIILSNTSLGETEQRASGAIFSAIWKHAESLR